MHEGFAISKAYNSVAMAEGKQAFEEGDTCPFCRVGVLAVSSSGLNLVCRKCGRIVIVRNDFTTEGHASRQQSRNSRL